MAIDQTEKDELLSGGITRRK